MHDIVQMNLSPSSQHVLYEIPKRIRGDKQKNNLLIKVHFNTLQILFVLEGILDKVVPYQKKKTFNFICMKREQK